MKSDFKRKYFISFFDGEQYTVKEVSDKNIWKKVKYEKSKEKVAHYVYANDKGERIFCFNISEKYNLTKRCIGDLISTLGSCITYVHSGCLRYVKPEVFMNFLPIVMGQEEIIRYLTSEKFMKDNEEDLFLQSIYEYNEKFIPNIVHNKKSTVKVVKKILDS